MPAPRIRPARTHDARERSRLYEICLRTGADGGDATGRFVDPLLLGEIYLGAYLSLEPELASVLDDGTEDGLAAGYVVGTADTAAFEDRLEREWWPSLRARYPLDAFPEGSPDAGLVRQIHSPWRTTHAWLPEFPAHLHVDLLPEAQGGGAGRRLMETLFAALRARGVPGVHLGVSDTNSNAIGFYEHLGFARLETPGGTVLGLRLG